MGGLILIIPVLAFDAWLLATAGRRQCKVWTQARAWPRLAGAAAVGAALGVWLAVFVEYKWGPSTRVIGFPVPVRFFHLEDGKWVGSSPATTMRSLGWAANFLGGLAAPFIPFKAAEFLRSVKAEL